MPAPPPWLAPHLRPDERPLWTLDPGTRAWPRVLASGLLAAWSGLYVPFAAGAWWRALPIWPETRVSPIVGALLAAAGFAYDAAERVVKGRFTAWAITDRRLVRVRTLGAGSA